MSVETVLVSIAAILIALEQGLVDAPTLSARLPGWVRSPRWRYVPALCVVAAAAIFGWRVWNPVAPANPLAKPQEKTIYLTKEVPTSDPKQTQEIARLKRMLVAARASQTTTVPTPQQTSEAISPPSPAGVLKPEDQAMLDTLKCEKAKKAEVEELQGFVRLAGLYQTYGAPGKDRAADAANQYSLWLADVSAYLRTVATVGFGLQQFEQAKGNEFMKAPSTVSADFVPVWREYQAKKTWLSAMVSELDFNRC